jgi:hypothetical protein
MTKPLTHVAAGLLISIFLAIVIFANASWWNMHPDTVLNFTHPVWQWLVDAYGAKNASQKLDLAFWVSTTIIVLGSVAATFTWRCLRRAVHG